jgi:hypothetical protein
MPPPIATALAASQIARIPPSEARARPEVERRIGCEDADQDGEDDEAEIVTAVHMGIGGRGEGGQQVLSVLKERCASSHGSHGSEREQTQRRRVPRDQSRHEAAPRPQSWSIAATSRKFQWTLKREGYCGYEGLPGS